MNTGEAGRRTGAEYFASLRRVVASRERIRVRYGSPAVRLIQDETGRVTGVRVGDGSVVRARRGVVLTCGGYEWNDEIKINALKASPMYFYGNPGNTGDGIRMAQAVGADLWHMNQMIGRAIGHFSEDGHDYNFVIGIHPPGYLITDKYGQRFANEVSQAQMKHSFYYELLKYDAEKQEYPRVPCYWVFDERRMNAAPLVSLRSGFVRAGYYDWSPDNSREVAKGWIKQADSIAELGKLAGVEDVFACRKPWRGTTRAARPGSTSSGGLLTRWCPWTRRRTTACRCFPAGPTRAAGRARTSGRGCSTRSASPSRGCTRRVSWARRWDCCTRPTGPTCRSRCASGGSRRPTRWAWRRCLRFLRFLRFLVEGGFVAGDACNQIRNLIHRYAEAVDRGRFEVLDELFADAMVRTGKVSPNFGLVPFPAVTLPERCGRSVRVVSKVQPAPGRRP